MTITSLPTPPNRNTQTPTEFSNSTDAFLAALPTFVTETNSTASDVASDATAAANSVSNASTYANNAATSAATAAASANAEAYNTGKTGGYSVGNVVYGTSGAQNGYSFRCIQDQAEGAVQPLTDTSYWVELFYVQEVLVALGDLGGGTDDINLNSGTVFTATVSTSTQTFTFSNPPSGRGAGFTLYLTNGGSQTVNWPSSVDWAGGSAPSLTTAGLDVIVFTTNDSGTTWYGFVAGYNITDPV